MADFYIRSLPLLCKTDTVPGVFVEPNEIVTNNRIKSSQTTEQNRHKQPNNYKIVWIIRYKSVTLRPANRTNKK